MKLDLNKAFIGLEGNAIPDSNMGKTLANLLANSAKGDAVKFWEIALQLNKGEVIDLDTSDRGKVKEFINNAEISNLVKAQLLLEVK